MQAFKDAPTLAWAQTPDDFEAFGTICRAYVEWCRERYLDT